MKDHKKFLSWLSLGVFFGILFFATIIPSVKGFSDPEFDRALNFLYENGLTKYQKSNDFRPFSTLTREQAAKFYAEFAKKVQGKTIDTSVKCEFSDLVNADPTLKDSIKQACQMGLIQGKGGKYYPKDPLTKAQALTILIRSVEGKMDEEVYPWWKNYLTRAGELNYTKELNLFGVNRPVTRYEVALILYRAANKGADGPVISTGDGGGLIETGTLTVLEKEFIIKFDESMDMESVENNFKIYPMSQVEFNWVDSQNLEIGLLDELLEETEYLINISEEAKTEEGKNLIAPIVKKFKTAGVAQIDFVSPMGDITDLTKNITVRFTKPMVPLTNLDNQPKCPITITPDLVGKCVWITTSTFQFRPEAGFPIGGKYSVTIPQSIVTMVGDKTVNSKSFTISTPAFKVYSTPTTLNKDQKLILRFNADVDLNNFKANFGIAGMELNDFDIQYMKNAYDEDIMNTISIMHKSGDWGYGKTYQYTIGAGIKSKRGNVPLGSNKTYTLKINELLTNYQSFVYIDENIENKEKINNMRFSSNNAIIRKDNPKILLTFYEEIDLNKDYFSPNQGAFNIKYAKFNDCSVGECQRKDNKKQIIIEFVGNIEGRLDIRVLCSKISPRTTDKTIGFATKNNNKILNYKFIDYYSSCVVFSNPVNGYKNNFEHMNYGDAGNAYSMSQVTKYTKNINCPYQEGVSSYVLRTKLDPSTDVKLNIEKELLDADNYMLDKNYNYSFRTNDALNEDKHVTLVDNRQFILVPTDIKPLGIGIQTINLDKVNVQICQGDFDINSIGYMTNKTCKEMDVNVNNLGFDTNFSVIDLNKIYGDFTKSMVNVKVKKLNSDLSQREIKYPRDTIITYMRTNKNSVLKLSKYKKLLWLTDFRTGELMTDQVKNIASYSVESKYDSYGRYLGKSAKFVSNISFAAEKDGLYEIKSDISNMLLLTLYNGENVLVDNTYYSNSSDRKITYVYTERPIYKPGDKVYIKGVVRVEKPWGYDISKSNDRLYIRDAKYNNIVEESVALSAMGSFEYELQLNEDAPLGNYTVSIDGGYASFAVEEYEKPDFKVEASANKENYLYSQNASVDVKAEYFLGAGLSNGDGFYNISATQYRFDGGKTKGYVWGENEYYWYHWWYSPYSSSSNIAYNVPFNLDTKGKAKLNIELVNNSSDDAKDMVYDVSTTVTDPNTKKSMSASASFKVLRSSVFAGMKMDKYYYDVGDDVKMDFVTVDFQGNKIGNENLKLSVVKIDYQYNKDTYRYEDKEKEMYSKDLTTNSLGSVQDNYKIVEPGKYRFEIKFANRNYKTTYVIYVSGRNLLRPKDQQHDLTIVPSKQEYSVGETAELVIQSPYVGVKALITIEKLNGILDYKVYDINSNSQIVKLTIDKEYIPNVHFNAYLIKDIAGSQDSLDKLKDIRLKMQNIEQELFSGNQYDYIIPRMYLVYDLVYWNGFVPVNIDDNYNKELLDELVELRKQEHSLLQDILPDYLIGSTNIKINTDPVKLKSNVTTDKSKYLPGEKSDITLKITDNDGNPINGEATVVVVDEALLKLKNESVGSILDYYYSIKSNNVRTVYNLSNLIRRLEFEKEENADNELRQSFNGDLDDAMVEYSMGMVADEADYAPSVAGDVMKSKESGGGAGGEEEIKLRSDFKDIAFYKGTVRVVNGEAKISVDKLPDDLTTWVVKGLVFTTDTKVGNFEQTFQTQKPLSMLPSIPRFFVAGDQPQLTMVLVNNTSQAMTVQTNIELTNAKYNNETKYINVPANGQANTTFDVDISPMISDLDWNNYFSTVKLIAKTNAYNDGVELKRNIIPYSTPEYTFTNGSTQDLSYEEKIILPSSVDQTQGKLDITLGSNILVNLTDSIENIVHMPYRSFYSMLSAAYKGAVLKGLFGSIDEMDKFNAITVYDYNSRPWKLDPLIQDIIRQIPRYQQADGGMSYNDDCVPSYWRETCSDWNLTAEFLITVQKLKDNGYTINSSIVDKAKNYYKNQLQVMINDAKNRGKEYRNIYPFYVLSLYEEKVFIENNLLKSYLDISNEDTLYLIMVLQNINGDQTRINQLLSELKNSSLIEARGTLLPANNHSWYRSSNLKTTALALQVFIKAGEKEKLLIENFARWLVYQKNVDGSFGSYWDSSVVIDSITQYIEYTGEFKDINFDAKAYLNSQVVMEEHFDMNDKFSPKYKSFSLKDYIKFGSDTDNSLGFEKKGSGRLYYDVGLRYFLPIEEIGPRDEGIIITRNYYKYDDYMKYYQSDCGSNGPVYYDYEDSYYPSKRGGGSNNTPCIKTRLKDLQPVDVAKRGDMLVGVIEVIIPHERNNVIVNNFIPAGAEIVNQNLDTTSAQIKQVTGAGGNGWWYGGFDHVEVKNDRLSLYSDRLYEGTYKYVYVIKLNHAGKYHHRPAVVEEMKRPEIWGRTKGDYFVVNE